MATILIVDDEPAIIEMLVIALEVEAYNCISASDASEARQRIATKRPDLILLDWMLPGQSGYTLTLELRRHQQTRDVPIIMLTARVSDDDIVRGLDAGADDYITKPFSTTELMSRMRALLRRASGSFAVKEGFEVAGLHLDASSHRVRANGKPLELAPTEFKLLRFLIAHPERVYSRDQLINQVWGYNAYLEDRTVDVHVRRLRKALEPSGHDRLIQTVRGTGYRFSDQA